jgi:hypothetical protein
VENAFENQGCGKKWRCACQAHGWALGTATGAAGAYSPLTQDQDQCEAVDFCADGSRNGCGAGACTDGKRPVTANGAFAIPSLVGAPSSVRGSDPCNTGGLGGCTGTPVRRLSGGGPASGMYGGGPTSGMYGGGAMPEGNNMHGSAMRVGGRDAGA